MTDFVPPATPRAGEALLFVPKRPAGADSAYEAVGVAVRGSRAHIAGILPGSTRVVGAVVEGMLPNRADALGRIAIRFGFDPHPPSFDDLVFALGAEPRYPQTVQPWVSGYPQDQLLRGVLSAPEPAAAKPALRRVLSQALSLVGRPDSPSCRMRLTCRTPFCEAEPRPSLGLFTRSDFESLDLLATRLCAFFALVGLLDGWIPEYGHVVPRSLSIPVRPLTAHERVDALVELESERGTLRVLGREGHQAFLAAFAPLWR